nr:phosphoglucomutase, cytoplasmic-like isoform X1 [Coffea arabica]
MEETCLLDLPENLLVTRIFPRLPLCGISSLGRVNKYLRQLISRRNFLESYLKFSPYTTVIVSHRYVSSATVPSFSLLQLEEDPTAPLLASLVRTPFQSGDVATIVGSSHGYICFRVNSLFIKRMPKHGYLSTLHVSNPIIGEFITLPPPPSTMMGDDGSVEGFGFGMVEKTKEFKILRLSCSFYDTDGEGDGCRGEVFRFEEYRWVSVQGPNPPFPRYRRYFDGRMNRAEMCPLSYRNRLHWLTQPNREDFLYCFDIAEERIFPIPPPPVLASAEMSVTVLDDLLSICVVSEDSIDIWQMLDYGVEGSWKRTRILDLGLAVRVPPLPSVPVLRLQDTGILLCHQSYETLKKVIEGEMSAVNITAGTQSQDVTAVSYIPRLESVTELVNRADKTNYKYLRRCNLHNFIQATLNTINGEGATIVVSGDSPFVPKDAIQIIIKMAAANGVRQIWVGKNGLLSTPAVSAVIRKRVGIDGSKASGAFILTGSHNPGSPCEDFGVKYMMGNGGLAPESVTHKIHEATKTIVEHGFAVGLPDVDLNTIGLTRLPLSRGQFEVEVLDLASDYVEVMKSTFDFGPIRKLISLPNFTFCFDALNGLAGALARRIFVEELGAEESSLRNCAFKEDFIGGYNFTNAESVARMRLGKTNAGSEPPDFGAVVDWDASCNMVFGKRFYVTASDAVAVIAANAVEAIPYFSGGLKGVARSMPTSSALDVVAKRLKLPLFEVPVGLEFRGNLMDAGLCSIWGEESCGMCCDCIRERDGIWAVLAWLAILADKNKDNLCGGRLVTIEDIVSHHWSVYGRHYYTRYDYENVDAGGAKELMAHLVKLQSSLNEVNVIIKGIHSDVSNVVRADEFFEYKDPVDGSISKHQGIRYLFEDGSRLVFCLSGTGSEVATIRVYIEQYEKYSSKTGRDSQEALAPLVEVAIKLSKMEAFTGRSAPTTIT